MAPSVAVLADDLTGAADTGVGFRRAGLRTAVGWELPLLSGAYDVLALDLATRGLPASAAAARTASAVAAAWSAGVSTLYKKVDSLLRGHPGAEVRAALDTWGPDAFAVVAPAFPAAGRTTVDGWQLAAGERVGSLPDLLHAAGISCVVGRDPVAARSAGHRALVCDASTPEDLRAVARAGVALGRDVVWVGTAGLAGVLPDFLRVVRTDAPTFVPAERTLTVVGSRAPIAREQVARLCDLGHPAVEVSRLAASLDAGESPIVVLDAPPGAEDPRLVAGLASQLAGHASLLGGLVATGGETAAAVLRAFGVTALELVTEVEPGLPLSLASGAWRGPVVTKAGTFGDADSLVRAVEALEGVR